MVVSTGDRLDEFTPVARLASAWPPWVILELNWLRGQQLEALAEALLDFTGPADLDALLAAHG